jgi:hypothetical protein
VVVGSLASGYDVGELKNDVGVVGCWVEDLGLVYRMG